MASDIYNLKPESKIKLVNSIYTVQEFADKYTGGDIRKAISQIILLHGHRIEILRNSENENTIDKASKEKSLSNKKQSGKSPKDLNMKKLARWKIVTPGNYNYIKPDTPLDIVRRGSSYIAKGKDWTGIHHDITSIIKPFLSEYPPDSLHIYADKRKGDELAIVFYTDTYTADSHTEYVLDGIEITTNDFIKKFNLQVQPDEAVEQLIGQLLDNGCLKRIQDCSEVNIMLTREDIIKKYNLIGQTDEFIDIFIKGLEVSEYDCQASSRESGYTEEHKDNKGTDDNISQEKLMSQRTEKMEGDNYMDSRATFLNLRKESYLSFIASYNHGNIVEAYDFLKNCYNNKDNDKYSSSRVFNFDFHLVLPFVAYTTTHIWKDKLILIEYSLPKGEQAYKMTTTISLLDRDLNRTVLGTAKAPYGLRIYYTSVYLDEEVCTSGAELMKHAGNPSLKMAVVMLINMGIPDISILAGDYEIEF